DIMASIIAERVYNSKKIDEKPKEQTEEIKKLLYEHLNKEVYKIGLSKEKAKILLTNKGIQKAEEILGRYTVIFGEKNPLTENWRNPVLAFDEWILLIDKEIKSPEDITLLRKDDVLLTVRTDITKHLEREKRYVEETYSHHSAKILEKLEIYTPSKIYKTEINF
ncbi:MAG: hypothetical protein QXZ20_02740, partial [Candidatus Aenigmatarchaeota archaeon]